MSRRTTVTANRLRRFATILLGTVALIFVMTSASNAVAQCMASSRSCGGNSASNDARCCTGLVCGSTGCCTAACRINNTLYSSGATNPQNPCQSCQPSLSTTSWTNKSNGVTCNDSNACTTQDKCQAGTCTGTPLSCDDHNSCTQDTCDPARGCVRQNLTGSCDDGNACTLGDTCNNGTCCAGTGRLTCNDNNACTNDSCSPSQGCVYTNNTNSCSDGNACTTGDKCGGGTCRPGTGTLSCNDSNGCTDDSCDPTLGCKHANNTASCSDGNPCTVGDACGAGSCRPGAPNSCDDSNPCTNDTCDRYYGGCKHTNNTSSCDDSNACTSGDKCSYGTCKPGTGTVSCNDNNPCTTDSCDPTQGCVYAPNQNTCNDYNACTENDSCRDGRCQGDPRRCDDSNVCTDDSCDPSRGCVYQNNTAPCDDHNTCTTDDACSAGRCQPTGSLHCDDFNPCTADSCDPSTGCVYSAVGSGAPCSDRDACTAADHCSGTECLPGEPVLCDDHNPCTADSCDPSTGCVYTPVDFGTPCNGGNVCTGFNYCSDGACVPATPVPCDDHNPCTDDTCDPAVGCVFTANTAPCDDGSACTLGDACSAGLCLPGTEALDCDDGSDCTADTCDPTSGCQHSPLECSFCSKSASVVVFDNRDWVSDASDNVQASLFTSLGHTVTTFTDIDAASINAALAGKQVLLIPEQKAVAFEDELHRVLDAPAIAAFQNFVNGGGGLIIHGSIFNLDQAFLEDVFGINIDGDGGYNGTWTLNPVDKVGTAFCREPDNSIDSSDDVVTRVVNIASVPVGGKVIYTLDDHSVVTLLSYGAGEIVVLGWNWENAAPLGANDGGWLDVLDRAVNQVAH